MRQTMNLIFHEVGTNRYLQALPEDTVQASGTPRVHLCQQYHVSKVSGSAPNQTVELTRERHPVVTNRLNILALPELPKYPKYELLETLNFDVMFFE